MGELAAAGYNRAPLVREVLADLDTPLSTYLKLARGPYSFLLESVEGGEQWGRYSFIGLPCREVLKVYGREVRLERDGEVVEREDVADPLAWIEAYAKRFKVAERPDLPRLAGGLMGYFGYDTVRYVEPRLAGVAKPDPLGTPDILLMLCEELVVFDNLSGKLKLIVHADPGSADSVARAEVRLDELLDKLRQPLALPEAGLAPVEVGEEDFVSGFSQAGFERAVERIREYIVDGDVMQVVPSQRLSIPYKAQPLDLYRALRCLNPSPYLYFMDMGNFHVVGSSPEILVRVEAGQVTVRPIAGTRPRGRTPAQDQALEEELLADPKERAEHVMLMDLGRNDVGRVSRAGGVQVTARMAIERYSHVMHIASNVVGELRDGLTAMDALRAAFPAGTLTGAPKIRAMEIIDELEPVKRGIYGGAVGYWAFGGEMDLAIAIRTAVIKDGELHVQAGGGVVADSVPSKEWDETMNKARAIFRAVAMVGRGLD
jgi:anthranilate synthase component 1